MPTLRRLSPALVAAALPARLLFGATPDVAGLSPDSGPASGGAAITALGYGFQPGATVKIGSGFASGVAVAGTTRLTASAPAAAPGSLLDVQVTNPDNSTAVLAGGWFADYADVPSSDPFHSAVVKITRKGITTGCGGGNYCPGIPVTRGQDGGVPAARQARRRVLAAAGDGDGFHGRPGRRAVRALDRAPRGRGHHDGLRRRRTTARTSP